MEITIPPWLEAIILHDVIVSIAAVLFAACVFLFLAPALLLCTRKEEWFADATECPRTGESKMNRFLVCTIVVWIMLVTRAFMDKFLEDHNFDDSPVLSMIVGAIVSSVAACAIACVRKAAYAFLVMATLTLMAMYLSSPEATHILVVIMLLVAVAVAAVTYGWVESFIIVIAASLIVGWTLVYVTLYWISGIPSRMEDARNDAATGFDCGGDKACWVHILVTLILAAIRMAMCFSWFLVKRCPQNDHQAVMDVPRPPMILSTHPPPEEAPIREKSLRDSDSESSDSDENELRPWVRD